MEHPLPEQVHMHPSIGAPLDKLQRLTWPSTGPVDHAWVSPALTAS
jgi:hypothetical protein